MLRKGHVLAIVLVSVSAVTFFSLFDTAFAQSSSTILVLEPIPSNVKSGETITFSGQLVTADMQYVITDAKIYIKDDVDFDIDTVLGTITTDKEGKFSATWEAKPRSSGAFDFYAVYEGGIDFAKARSQTYSVRVSGTPSDYTPSYSSSSGANTYAGTTLIPTKITLDSFPNSANSGQIIKFSGKLTADGKGLANAVVYIKDEDALDFDDFLAQATTDSSGRFSANWKVKNVDSGDRQLSSLILDLYGGLGQVSELNYLYNIAEANTVEIYAEFVGDNQYSKSNTCLIENVDGVLQSKCYNKILSIQDDSSFENLIMSVVLGEMGIDSNNMDSLQSILTNQADSTDAANFEDLLLEALQDELDLGDIDLTMEQMLELIDDPSLADNYQTSPASQPSPQITTPSPTSHSIRIDGTNHLINYVTTSGKIQKIIPDHEIESLILVLDTTNEGYVSLAIPRDILDAKMGNSDDVFFVLVDGDESFFLEEKYVNGRMIAVSLLKGAKQVEIIGTYLFEDSVPIIPRTTITIPPTITPKQPKSTVRDSDNDGIIDDWDQCPFRPETKNGYYDYDGCPDSKPRVPDFVNPAKGAQYYIDRYNNEPEYKKWFHESYPEYSITQAIELAIPDAFSETKKATTPPDTKQDSSVCGPGTVLKDGICKLDKCGPGTVLKNGKCVLEEKKVEKSCFRFLWWCW